MNVAAFLVGSFDNGGQVHEVRPATNQNQERSDRFEISPLEFAETQNAADEADLDIIGIYHSHPDWPPISPPRPIWRVPGKRSSI